MTTNLSPDYELLMLRDMVQDLTKEVEHERNRADQMTEALIIQRQIHGEAQFNTTCLNFYRETLRAVLVHKRFPKAVRLMVADALEWEELIR